MNKKAKKKRVKYITTNLANQIKHEHKKVCATKKTSIFIEWIPTGRKKKHIHLIHKISSLYIPLYKNVKAKQQKKTWNVKQILRTIYIYKGRRANKKCRKSQKLSEQ